MNAPMRDRRRRHSPDSKWGKPIRQMRGARYYGNSKGSSAARNSKTGSWSDETKEAMGKILDSYFPPEESHRCNAVSIHTGKEDDGEEEKADNESGDKKPGEIFTIRRSTN